MTPEEAIRARASGAVQDFIVSDWKSHLKNSLRGFVTFKLPSGLMIRNVCLHEKNGRRWVSMPARPFKRADGTEGWQPIVEFATSDARERFEIAALAALDRYFESAGHE